MKTIAVMAQMSFIAKVSNAKMEPSSVNLVIALLLISVVMVIVTVETCLMKLIALQDSQAVVTVQKHVSNVTTTSAFQIQTFAMGQMTAVTILMKLPLCARTLIATKHEDSNVTTRNAFHVIRFVMELTIAVTALMKTITRCVQVV